MTDDRAQAWVRERFGEEALARLGRFVDMVREENSRQNLISPASVEGVWTRHVLDSAQLVPLAPEDGLWVDIGTGAGFPGLVVAALRPQATWLIEPRKRRAEFLEECASALGLANVAVTAMKIESVRQHAAVISARAVASVENLLHAALPCATADTRWLLPRGRSGRAELSDLRQRWQGVFHVEQSLTDPESVILMLDRVSHR